MLIKYAIRFSLGATKKDGSRSIRLRVTWASQRLDITLPASIPQDWWDSASQRPKPRYISADGRTSAATITAAINAITAQVDERFDRARIAGRIPTYDEVADGLVGGRRHNDDSDDTVITLMRQYVTAMERENGWQYNTSKHFATISGHISDFAPSACMGDITSQWIADLSAHMTAKGLQNATVNTMVTRLRWFLRWADKNGHHPAPGWDDFRPRLKAPPKPVIYLTIEELHALIEHDYTADSFPHLDNVRDVFVMQCATGLRYSDIARLTWEMVSPTAISITTQKTAEPLVIDVNDLSRMVLAKYRPLARTKEDGTPTGPVLHVVSNQKYNMYIKEVCRLAGIDTPVAVTKMVGSRRIETTHPKWELVTTHVGRKTFVVTMLTAGASPLAVMRFTGHKDYKTMSPYIAISDTLRHQATAAFNAATKKKPDK